MNETLLSYLLFVGTSLHFIAFIMFGYLWYKTIHASDGLGLAFLRVLTFCLTVGSLVIFYIRFAAEYGWLGLRESRALAIINPILMVAVALYLNYLFYHSKHKLNSNNSKNIRTIKMDVKDVQSTVDDIQKNQKGGK